MLAGRSQDDRSAALAIRIICAAWIASKAASWKLWAGNRLFPFLPVSEYLPDASPGVHTTLAVLSIISITLLFIFTRSRALTALVVFLEFTSCLLDQMRWQPWEYHYLLLLLASLFAKDKKHFLQLVGFSLACIYFFSGLHKFSGGFLHNIWEKLILRRLIGIGPETMTEPIVHYAGTVIPIAEITLGVGLLFFRSRWAVIGAVAMHLAIMLALSPVLLDYNIVVIPWNAAMAALVFLVFKIRCIGFDLNSIKYKSSIAAMLLFVFFPVLGLFGHWDNYLSFNLYSGTTPELTICTTNKQLAIYARKGRCGEVLSVSAKKWAMAELNVPMYPEKRAFKVLKRQWQNFDPVDNADFFYSQYPYGTDDIKKIE